MCSFVCLLLCLLACLLACLIVCLFVCLSVCLLFYFNQSYPKSAHVDHTLVHKESKIVANCSPGLDSVSLWRLPGPRSAPDANRSEVSGEVKAKMAPSWAKLGPSCVQDGPS